MAEYLVMVSEDISSGGGLLVEATTVKVTESGDLLMLDDAGPVIFVAAGEWYYVERGDAAVEEVDLAEYEEEDYDEYEEDEDEDDDEEEEGEIEKTGAK